MVYRVVIGAIIVRSIIATSKVVTSKIIVWALVLDKAVELIGIKAVVAAVRGPVPGIYIVRKAVV